MKPIFVVMRSDLYESLRSRWFLVYLLVFSSLVALIFASGVTNSYVLGFTGLTRLLLIFIQACNVILPVFIMVTTVKSIAGDRDAHILEYMLSFPVSLKDYYWGKLLGRFIVVLIPLIFAMCVALAIGIFSGGVPWALVFLYTVLLICSAFTFLGIGFFVSTLVRSQEMAVGVALFAWLFLIAFIDIALIGIMIKNLIAPEVIFSVALLNPVQVFRVAAISLFDPVLSVIGPAAYFILDRMGRNGFLLYALLYSIFLGAAFAFAGYFIFKKKDLL